MSGTTMMILTACLAINTALAPEPRWMQPGTVGAIVIDSSSMKPLAGATVTLMSRESEAATVALSDASGAIHFSGVSTGSYTLKFELDGFVTMQIGPFHVRSDQDDNPQIPEFLAVLNPERWVERIR